MIRKLLLIGIGTETIIKMVYCFTSTGAFYYLLGNLHPRFQSRINTIQLLASAKYITISEYGIDRILEPVVEDICKLESENSILKLFMHNSSMYVNLLNNNYKIVFA